MEKVVRAVRDRVTTMKYHPKPNRQRSKDSSRWRVRLYDSLEDEPEKEWYITLTEGDAAAHAEITEDSNDDLTPLRGNSST